MLPNAARHLAPGGRLVVELGVPGIRRFPPGQAAVPFHVGEHHVGLDTYDLATQQGTSHHYRRHPDGTRTYGASNFRYIWPAECDLMAQLAGMELERRAGDWARHAFTGDSGPRLGVAREVPRVTVTRSATWRECPRDREVPRSRGRAGRNPGRPGARRRRRHSHSMVPGGLLVTSSTTRLTSRTSLVMRFEIRASTS